MLTANRFDEIKAAIERLKKIRPTGNPIVETADHIGSLQMLADLAAEVDRMRQVPLVHQRGHVKPVILDAQGQAVAPLPIALQLAFERREQFAADRLEAIMSLDPAKWRTFALRWGLAPPPGGWENHEAITNVMHSIRVALDDEGVPQFAKDVSLAHLKSRGIQPPR